MANGNPKYGGTNSVPALDIGQVGGTRNGASLAQATLQVERGAMRPRTVKHPMAQLAGEFEDHLGLDGEIITWRGLVVCSNKTTADAIVADLNAALTGFRRSAGGVLQAFDANAIRETQLTDWDGTVITTRARIQAWRETGRRLNLGATMQIEVVFKALG